MKPLRVYKDREDGTWRWTCRAILLAVPNSQYEPKEGYTSFGYDSQAEALRLGLKHLNSHGSKLKAEL